VPVRDLSSLLPRPEADEDPAAACREVSIRYRSASVVVEAVTEVDATFPRGRLSVLAGPSGSGKSSLLRALAGLQPVHAGTIVVDGVDLGRLGRRGLRRLRRRSIGYVLEEPSSNLLGYLRAEEQLALAARLRGAGRARGTAEAPELLDALGLADRRRAFPAELSGGQQQRVAFAAAAIGNPALLLADEPTAALDTTSGALLIRAMRDLADRGRTLVVASHDPEVIGAADVVVRLRDGRVALV
jgi:putative ABC transport system ATP-binding protein